MDRYCLSYVYKLFLSVLFTIEIFFHSVSGEIRCEPLQLSYGIVCKCNATYCDTIDPIEKVPKGEFILYTSNKDGLRFSRTKGLFSNLSSQQSDITFKIDKLKKYQKLFGFGGAFTDSAGINILSLSKEAQDNLLRSYFSTDGIEYNFGRVPIGGCDFSTHPYTLDDGSQDDNLGKFSLAQEDYTYKIPLIKRAQAMSNQKINLVGTAWSAPSWMKTNQAITGLGVLKKEYYNLWAKYHIRFLESYKKEGLNFWGLTTGNEPINGFVPFFIRFNSMGWLPKDHGRWIGENLGPMIRSSQFNQTKIISFDDQRLVLPIWAYEVMSNKKAAEYIDGIGIHWYWDFIIPVEVVVNLHNTYPDKFIINTESSQGDKPWETKVEPGSWDRGRKYVDDIIENLNNWLSGWIEWNLAVDMSGGPNWVKNFVDAPILVDEKKDEFYKQPMFYALGHFSKFIKPDAVRIDITPQTYKGTVRVLAVLNPDSSTVLVIHNGSRKKVSVTVVSDNENEAVLKLTPHSFNTLVYW